MRRDQSRLGGFWLDKVSGSKNYYLCWYDAEKGEVCRRSTRTDILHEAERILAEKAAAQASHLALPTEAPLSKALIRYYENHGKTLASVDGIFQAFGLWMEFFGEITLSDLTPQRQRSFHAWLMSERNYAPTTVSRILAFGKAALKRAVAEQEVTWHPPIIEVDKRNHVRKPKARILDRDEIAALLDAIPNRAPQQMFLAMICIGTLCRPDAALELKRDQIDLAQNIVRLNQESRPQTTKFRPTLPLTRHFRRWVALVPHNAHVVSWAGRSIRNPYPTFNAAVLRAGLDRPDQVHLYSFRRSGASWLRANGVSPEDMQGFLGHVNPQMRVTNLYVEYDPRHLSKARDALDEWAHEIDARMKTHSVSYPLRWTGVTATFLPTGETIQRRKSYGKKARVTPEGEHVRGKRRQRLAGNLPVNRL